MSVRLECVMHAASVHPEPGSNSLKIVSNPISRFKSFRVLILSCFLVFSHFTLLKGIVEFCMFVLKYYLSYFVLSLVCCSIFKDRLAAALAASLVIIAHRLPFVNTFLKSF